MSTSCVTDDELVARARDGDHAAFGDLVDRHRAVVYRVALAALRSHPEAEDAAQEAFVLAWRRLATFRGAASFKTWLLTIAWHQAINRRRTMVRWWKRMVQIDGDRLEMGSEIVVAVASDSVSGVGRKSGYNGTAADTPEQLVAGAELRRTIEQAIRSLSPKLRDALLLAQSGDYSYHEIGSMLNVPLGTIKWRVSEARRLVRMYLGDRGHGHVR